MKSVVIMVIGATLLLSGCARQDSSQKAAPFHVGFEIVDIPCEQRTLTVAVWYPTQEAPTEYQYMDPHQTVRMLAFEGEPDGDHGPLPVSCVFTWVWSWSLHWYLLGRIFGQSRVCGGCS